MSKLIGELVVGSLILLIGITLFFMCADTENSPSFLAQVRANRFQQGGGGPVAKADKVGDAEHTVTHGNRKRHYVVHLPKGHDGKKQLPLVLVFHGGMGRPDGVRTQSHMNEVADKFGFMVVYPEGTGITRLLTFNAGTCCGFAVRERVDDVGFVRHLVEEELPKHYRVDSQRIYATGISNGGMLCHRLACELSDRIAAIAPIAGGMGVDGPKPRRPVPVIEFHGKKDNNVPFDGGVGKNAVQPIPHKKIEDVIAWWAKVDNCQEKPVEVQEKDDFIMKRFEPAAGQAGAPVVLYTLPEGGHNWPGGVDTTAHLGTGKLIKSVDASSLMWEFFSRHTLSGPAKSE